MCKAEGNQCTGSSNYGLPNQLLHGTTRISGHDGNVALVLQQARQCRCTCATRRLEHVVAHGGLDSCTMPIRLSTHRSCACIGWLTSGNAVSVPGEVLQDLSICNAARRLSSSLNVAQLVHCFLAHSLQHADGVCLLADVWLPCCGPDGGHLQGRLGSSAEVIASAVGSLKRLTQAACRDCPRPCCGVFGMS